MMGWRVSLRNCIAQIHHLMGRRRIICRCLGLAIDCHLVGWRQWTGMVDRRISWSWLDRRNIRCPPQSTSSWWLLWAGSNRWGIHLERKGVLRTLLLSPVFPQCRFWLLSEYIYRLSSCSSPCFAPRPCHILVLARCISCLGPKHVSRMLCSQLVAYLIDI